MAVIWAVMDRLHHPITFAPTRRAMLIGSMGGLALAHRVLAHQPAERMQMDKTYTPPGHGLITGKGPGDFDFLTGEWRIDHSRRPDPSKEEWTNFSSSASVHRVLDGMGSIEELRKPDRSFMGMGVRVWLPEQAKWADHWTSAANGIVNPPQLGQFIDGEGVFLSSEAVEGIDWLYRGVWDQIGDGRCRWHQSASRDGGKSWQWNWWMMWTRLTR
jgi:hypothetical protein